MRGLIGKYADLEAKNESTDDIGASDVIETIPQDTGDELLAGEHKPVERRVHALGIGIWARTSSGVSG
jgi:hypothetical protein